MLAGTCARRLLVWAQRKERPLLDIFDKFGTSGASAVLEARSVPDLLPLEVAVGIVRSHGAKLPPASLPPP